VALTSSHLGEHRPHRLLHTEVLFSFTEGRAAPFRGSRGNSRGVLFVKLWPAWLLLSSLKFSFSSAVSRGVRRQTPRHQDHAHLGTAADAASGYHTCNNPGASSNCQLYFNCFSIFGTVIQSNAERWRRRKAALRGTGPGCHRYRFFSPNRSKNDNIRHLRPLR
jgi:hypothetical protein